MGNMAEPVGKLWKYFTSVLPIAAIPSPMDVPNTLAASAQPRDPPTIVNNSRKNTPVIIFPFDTHLKLNHWVKRMHTLGLQRRILKTQNILSVEIPTKKAWQRLSPHIFLQHDLYSFSSAWKPRK